MNADTRWHAVADKATLAQRGCQWIASAADAAISLRESFHLVLAGGSTPQACYKLLRALDTDWSRWWVYFGDERCVPIGHAQRNDAMAREAWLDHVPIPCDNIQPMPAELGAEAGAQAYVRTLDGIGIFDMVLLGLGEDGHTASLFPGHDWGTAPDAIDVLAVFDSPKPPPQRVSLSASRLSRAREVLFLVSGTEKRSAVRRWKAGDTIVAATIQPDAGVDVLLDAAALPS